MGLLTATKTYIFPLFYYRLKGVFAGFWGRFRSELYALLGHLHSTGLGCSLLQALLCRGVYEYHLADIHTCRLTAGHIITLFLCLGKYR